MINFFVHLGLPHPSANFLLQRIFAAHKNCHYLNNEDGQLPDDLSEDYGLELLLTRRHIYPVAPFDSPSIKRIITRAENDSKIIGFSLPHFLVAEPEEVDLVTRAHRLYDKLFFGVKIVVVIANQLDMVRMSYVERNKTHNDNKSLDQFIEEIIANKYYGLSVDLRYLSTLCTLEAIFGKENIIVLVAEDLLENPVKSFKYLWEELNEQPTNGQKTTLNDKLDTHDFLKYAPSQKTKDILPPLSDDARRRIWALFASTNNALIAAQNNPLFEQMLKVHGYPL